MKKQYIAKKCPLKRSGATSQDLHWRNTCSKKANCVALNASRFALCSFVAMTAMGSHPHFLNDSAGIPLTYIMILKAASSLVMFGRCVTS